MQSRRQNGYVKRTYRLIPSTVTGKSPLITATDSNNMFTDTDSITYGVFNCTSTGSSAYGVTLDGFDFSQIPSNAIVSDYNVKIKMYIPDGAGTSFPATTLKFVDSTSSSSGTDISGTDISGTTVAQLFTSAPYVMTWPSTKKSNWNQISSIGNKFGIRFSIKTVNGDFYIYGAEIEVTALVPRYHTVKLLPSTYSIQLGSGISSSNVSVTDINNAYTDTDSDTYATITHTVASTALAHVFLSGFDFSLIPDDAQVVNLKARMKARTVGIPTSASAGYVFHLYSQANASKASNVLASADTAFNGTVKTVTIDNITIPFSQIKSYGSNFCIGHTFRRNITGTQSYIYIYGVELEVLYALPD